MVWDVNALKNKTHLFLENKKQNTLTSKNNLESTKVPRIHESP